MFNAILSGPILIFIMVVSVNTKESVLHKWQPDRSNGRNLHREVSNNVYVRVKGPRVLKPSSIIYTSLNLACNGDIHTHFDTLYYIHTKHLRDG